MKKIILQILSFPLFISAIFCALLLMVSSYLFFIVRTLDIKIANQKMEEFIEFTF